MSPRRVPVASAAALLTFLALPLSPSWAGPVPIRPLAASSSTPAAPVTRVALTDASGDPTDVAVQGLVDLGEPIPAQGGTALGPVAGGAGLAATVPLPITIPSSEASANAEDVADVALLTPPIDTREFLVAGVTWDGAETLPPDARIFIRVLEDDVWSDWIASEPDDAAPDGGEPVAGTDPFVTGGADAVQIQVTTASGANLPGSLGLSLYPANPSSRTEVISEPTPEPDTLPTEDPVAPAVDTAVAPPAVVSAASFRRPASAGGPAVAANPAVLATAVAQPAVISRAAWGADPSIFTWQPTYATLKAAIVHHTAGTNTYTADQSASIVRGIYRYHAVTRGWGDIGYNFLVDKYGQIFEGRAGSLTAGDTVMPVGAHASGFNTGALGISAMGDYTQVNAPQVILDSMASVISWRFSRAGIDPASSSGLISPGTTFRPAGQALGRIFAHRDVGATVCPGNDIYGRLPALRSAVAALIAAAPTLNRAPVADAGPDLSVVAGASVSLPGRGTDADGDPLTYVWRQTSGPAVTLTGGTTTTASFVAPAAAGALTFTLTVGDGRLLSSADSVTVTVTVPPPPAPASPRLPSADRHDWSGDGAADVMARDGSGIRWLYPGNGKGGFGARVQGGGGWNDMDVIVGPGDWDGNGTSDLLARDAAGGLWLYPGDGKGGFGTRSQVGSGWTIMNVIVGPGDWDGNGTSDLLARDAAGGLWFYPGDGKGGFGTRSQVGSGWSMITAIT